MYFISINQKMLNSYKSIRRLYYNEFLNIALNLNFILFNQLLEEYHIYDYLDDEGLKIGAIRDKKINDDESELLTDDELLLVLNLCLLNGFSIKYSRG